MENQIESDLTTIIEDTDNLITAIEIIYNAFKDSNNNKFVDLALKDLDKFKDRLENSGIVIG